MKTLTPWNGPLKGFLDPLNGPRGRPYRSLGDSDEKIANLNFTMAATETPSGEWSYDFQFYKYFHSLLVLEILLNSWSSVLSYNHFNFAPIFSKEQENVGHESTFVRQTFYFLINMASNIG